MENKFIHTKSLIHCITNPISINQCANAVLAVGAKPIMAEHPKEAKEITKTADALMLNIGNITDARMEAMPVSLGVAKEKNIPVVLDIVGCACSTLRRSFVTELLQVCVPTVIKGNYSEIFALYNEKYYSSGVDADNSLDAENAEKAAIFLAKKHQTIILATGKKDIATDGKRIVYVNNGTEQLSSVTGTGCMLGALCAAFMTLLPPMEAVISACVYMGVCGEMAKTDSGNSSFMLNLIDKLSTLDKEEIFKHMNLEEKIG